MVQRLELILEELTRVEGEWSDDKDDSGGQTKWGVTLAVARAFGYKGDMRDLTKDQAKEIFRQRYWYQPHFSRVAQINEAIAEEMFEAGVNLGTGIAAGFLQRALNVLNRGGTMYPDIEADGLIGNMTLAALKEYLANRGDDGVKVMLRMLNSYQAVRYTEIAEKRPKDEKFIYGWVLNRVNVGG